MASAERTGELLDVEGVVSVEDDSAQPSASDVTTRTISEFLIGDTSALQFVGHTYSAASSGDIALSVSNRRRAGVYFFARAL